MFNDYDFHERKKERTKYYFKYIHGWKLITCTACSGSGYYDHNDNPKCGCCEGTGKERVSPEYYKQWLEFK